MRFHMLPRGGSFTPLLGRTSYQFVVVTTLMGLVLIGSFVCNAQLHFVSLGNWGSGSASQQSVATVLKSKAKEYSVSFIVSPGANFVTGGVECLNDSKWEKAFQDPYEGSALNIPFFTVLGDADWQANYTAQPLRTNLTYGYGTEEKVPLGPRWTIPNWWYHYVTHFPDASEASTTHGSADGSIGFVFIDTFILAEDFKYQNITKLQWNEVKQSLDAAVKIFDWVVVVGDRAIFSSGSSKGDPYLANTLRHVLKERGVDVYISGNDYDMEVIEDGPLLHINCGTGYRGDDLPRSKVDNSVQYSSKAGFCHHTVTRRFFSTEFIDGFSGLVLKNHTLKRNVRDRSVLDRFHLYRELPPIYFVPIPQISGLPAGPNDLFVIIVGTIGLLVTLFVLLLSVLVAVQRSVSQKTQ